MAVGMIELFDFNQTLVPPTGFELEKFEAHGMYLWAKYVKPAYELGTQNLVWFDTIEIYLNDMGREVARVTGFQNLELPLAQPRPPVSGWYKFKNGFLIVLQGLQEMIRCRNK